MPDFRTIADAARHASTHAPTRGFGFQDMRGVETRYPYPELEKATANQAAALQQMGLRKGDRVGLIVVEPENFVITFLACMRTGIIPVPMYPPLSFGSLDAYTARTARVLALSEARVVVASSRLQNVLWQLVDDVPSLERLAKVEDLRAVTGQPVEPEITPEDIAFLQYTSGSTADPKGVMVTHASLVANCTAIMEHGLQFDPEVDIAVAWLPLYHDMGLIGFVIAPLLYAGEAGFIPTMRFIKRPSVWMETLHEKKATVSFGPNFGYALATKRVKEAELDRWDLSRVRVLGCGAEPIQAETMRAFTELFHTRCGLPKNAIMPAYGMAEATLAISLKTAPEAMVTNTVDLGMFQTDGIASSPTSDKALTVEHVACGIPFPGHDVAAFDDDGNRLAECREGELRVFGPSVTPGYFKNPEQTAETFIDGWLRTGDLGYIKDDMVYCTGRIKDLIILNGRNIHPQAIEWATSAVEGVRKGNVVAFARPGIASEEVVVVLETRHPDIDALIANVKRAVRSEISVAPADVICLPPGSLPKTSSGKLQRRKTRDQYLTQQLGVDGTRTIGTTASRTVLARHVAKSMWSRAKHAISF